MMATTTMVVTTMDYNSPITYHDHFIIDEVKHKVVDALKYHHDVAAADGGTILP
jgi:hypothetical protein